jgi:hypothetical protein
MHMVRKMIYRRFDGRQSSSLISRPVDEELEEWEFWAVSLGSVIRVDCIVVDRARFQAVWV